MTVADEDQPNRISVIVTTKDRPQLVLTALRSILSQSVTVAEVVVIDDGSATPLEDALPEDVRESITLIRNQTPQGIIRARNQAFDRAGGDLVFTLDDDAVFSDDQVLANVVRDFDPPEVGAVTVPITDHFLDGRVAERMKTFRRVDDFPCVSTFSGGANAIRRELFQMLGGYQGDGRQGEERNFCIRMLALGYITRVASDCRVEHFPQHLPRDIPGVHRSNMHASVRFAWNLVPAAELVPYVLVSFLKHLSPAWRAGAYAAPFRGIIAGTAEALRNRRDRDPVPREVFYAFRELSSGDIPRRSEVHAILRSRGISVASESIRKR